MNDEGRSLARSSFIVHHSSFIVPKGRRTEHMGHKIHPTGLRIGVIYDWQGKWYAGKNYTELLHEDVRIRNLIQRQLSDASVSKIDIDRNANQAAVTIHTAKPGI